MKKKSIITKPVEATPLKIGDSLTIIGRRWFDKINGNTYFSAQAIVNGIQLAVIEYDYGYGNQYEHEMLDKLTEIGYTPTRMHYLNGSKESPWAYCERMGINYHATHSDVRRKKDL